MGIFTKVADSAWRMAGSPRVPGAAALAKTVSGAGGALGSLPGVVKGLFVMALLTGAAVVAVVVVVKAFDPFSRGDKAPEATVAPLPYLTEVDAVKAAVAAAIEKGMKSDDFAHISRRIQMRDYAAAIGESARVEAGFYEVRPETEVWAVAFTGEVTLDIGSARPIVYDNLTVVLDALSGKVYRVEAFYGDFETPARAPVWLQPRSGTPLPAGTARSAK